MKLDKSDFDLELLKCYKLQANMRWCMVALWSCIKCQGRVIVTDSRHYQSCILSPSQYISQSLFLCTLQTIVSLVSFKPGASLWQLWCNNLSQILSRLWFTLALWQTWLKELNRHFSETVLISPLNFNIVSSPQVVKMLQEKLVASLRK